MQRFRLSVLGCLVACGSFAVGQDNPAITVSMNDQANFVLSGNGFSTFGIQFFSPSGSLNPAPMGVDGEVDASPFSFSLSNTISDVTLGTLPPAVVLDGDVTLTAGWNPLGRRDVGYYYGLGETAVGPFFIAEDSFRGECVDCVEPPLLPIQVDFDDDFQFTLTGYGHQLTSFQFSSESGSLLPATTPAPFSSTTTNTPNLVQFAQEGTAVELDGTVTLGAGWSEFVGGRDLTYQYNLAAGQVGEGGPFNVRSRVYPPQIDWPRLLFSFDDNDRFVINGAGQPLTEIALQSASGSLIPDNANPGPFVSVSGDASQVVYSSPNAAVVVDGTLTLGVSWATGAPDGRRDARYTYDLAGDTREYGPYQVSSREYPREISWPRLTASLDENDFIVLSGGSGHPLNQVDVSSRSGSLRTSDAVGPFSSLGTNSESLVEYVADSPLILEGQLTLGTAWARGGAQDVRVEYDLERVASNTTIVPPRSEYPICFTGDQGNAVGVFIDRQNRFVLRGEGHQLESLQLSSDGGALVPGESAAPFSAFGSNTPELVQFVAENGNVAIEGLVVLSTEWNEELGIKDVRIDLGNIQQPSNVYSGCFTPGLGQGSHDSGGELVGLIESDGRVSLYSVGGVVAADMIELTSDSGNLVPAGDAGPFDSLVSNNAFQVIFAIDSSEVLIDGSLSLDVRINDANNNDIAAIWQHNGGNPVAFAIGRSAEVVPEPSSAWLFWASLLGLTFTRRSRSTETNRTRIEKATPTMQTSRTLLAVACLLCIQTQHVLAQDDPKFSLFLDEASKFVIASDGESTSGFDIKSASGSLVPIGDGSFQANAAPFVFLLANNQNQITWGNLGSTVTIDGLVTLDAGWNQAGTQDVVYSYSSGPDAVGPITMPVGNYTECTDCPLPPPQFSLSDDNKIELTAFGQELVQLRANSNSSSLVPGDSAAPFQSFSSNTNRSIILDSPDKIAIDGKVTLSAGWNERVGGRDLRFWYAVEEVIDNGGGNGGPGGDGEGVSGAINDAGFMVVSGSGQQLVGLEFKSNTSSLIPIPPGTLRASAAPFAFLLANRPDNIVFGNLGSSVTLQGDLVTQVGFSGVDAGQEIQASWGKGATPVRFPINGIISDGEDPGNSPNSVLRGPFLLPAQEYPPQVNWPRIGVTLNDDNQFVIEGSGHPINQFEFNSRNASLVPSAEAGPFASVVEATERRVIYEAAENSEVILEGSVTLGTAWNDKALKDVRYSYDLIGDTRNYSFSVDQREYPVVPVCFDGAVARLGVFIDLSDRINLTGNGQQLSELSLSSAGGALIPGESAAPFARFDSNTSQLISMVADAGPVTVSGVVTLSASWDSASGIQDLHANFGDQQLPESVYPRCVNPDDPTFPGGNPGDGDGFFAVVGADDRITLFNEGQIQIAGIDLISNAGLLAPVPDDDPSPFSFFLSNTNNQITYGNLGTTVTVNGALTLSARYLGQFPEGDLFATWGNGATPVAFPVTRSGPVVPEPSTTWMLLPVFFTATMLRRRRR